MTIDDIFAALPEEPAQDAHEFLVIDPATRTIKVPASESIFGVEGDEDGERKYFISPRYVGDHLDLAACFLSIVYRNANGETDQYLVTDAAVNGEYVTFSWLLSEKVVKYKGAVQFRFDADTAAGPAWGTTMAQGTSLEGMEPEIEASTVEEETSDVVTQLRDMVTRQTGNVEAVGAAQVQKVTAEGTTQVNTVKATGDATEAAALAAIEAKGQAVLASIPAEYTDLEATVDRLTRDRAAAIVCQAEGELLQITDASNDPLQGLRIFGKTEQTKTTGMQLANLPNVDPITINGVTWACKNGVVSATGTASTTDSASSGAKIFYNLPIIAGTYYISGDQGGVRVYACITKSDGSKTYHRECAITLDGTETLCQIYCQVTNATVSTTVYPMVNAGEEALPWEPYSGGMAAPRPDWPMELKSIQGPAARVCGTNLCNLPDMAASEISGITWTYKDGAAIANGTATAQSNVAPGKCPLNLLPGTYTVSGGDNGIYVIVTVQRGNLREYYTSKKGQPVTFETISGDVLYLYTQAPNGTTAENVTVYPMVNSGTEALPWEPYKEPQALAITTPGSLPGIPVASGGNYTEANGQQWIADEVDLARGVYVQRVTPYAMTGAEDWYLSAVQTGDTMRFDVNLSLEPGAAAVEAVCAYFPCNGSNVPGVWCLINEVHLALRVKWHYATLEEFKAFLAERYAANEPVVVYYALANPVETALTDVELQAYLALHSNKPTTTVLNDAGAHMVLEYAADPKTFICNQIAAAIAAK